MNLVNINVLSDDKMKITYVSNVDGELKIKLFENTEYVFQHTINVVKNSFYWTSFGSNWYDKEVHFVFDNFTQIEKIDGIEKSYSDSFYGDFLVSKKIETRTKLCDIFDKNGSDKSSQWTNGFSRGHNYSRLYHEMFSDFVNQEVKIFEIGLGTNDINYKYSMGFNGAPCASLVTWYEYFENAKVFGADIDTNILIDTEKYKTFYCDQTNEKIIQQMWGNKQLDFLFQIIIDDGIHEYEYNVKFLENSLHKIDVGGYYIIEDVRNENLLKWYNYYQNNQKKYENFSFNFIKLNCDYNKYDNNLIILKRKN